MAEPVLADLQRHIADLELQVKDLTAKLIAADAKAVANLDLAQFAITAMKQVALQAR